MCAFIKKFVFYLFMIVKYRFKFIIIIGGFYE